MTEEISFDDLDSLPAADDGLDSVAAAAPETDVRTFDFDLDQRRFMSRLCETAPAEELDALLRGGFNAAVFSAPIRTRLSFVLDVYRATHALPTLDALLKHYGDFRDVCLLPTGEERPTTTLAALYDEVRYDAFLTEMTLLHEQQRRWFNDRAMPVDAIWRQMQERHRDLGLIMGSSSQNVMSLGSALTAVAEQVRTSATEADWGIQLPFPFLNDQLRGLQPGEMTVVVAKTGVGKTWATLMCAASALTGNPFLFTPAETVKKPPRTAEQNLRDRKRVLYVSLEMPVVQIARRMSALLTKLGYGEIRSGKFLDGARERQFFETVDKAIARFGDRMLIAQLFTADEIAAYADMAHADLVVVDGFYLLGGLGEKRWEKVQDNARELRLHSLRANRHYLLSSQMARGRDELAFSQSIEQDASAIVELQAPSVLRQVRKVVFKTRKVRDGDVGQEFLYSWDYTNLRLHEEGPYLAHASDPSRD